jgi:virginiamycin B lyase
MRRCAGRVARRTRNILPFPFDLDGDEDDAEDYAFTLEDTWEETMTEGCDSRDPQPSTTTRSSRWDTRKRGLGPRATAIAGIAAALILAVVATTTYTQFASRRPTSPIATSAPAGRLSKFFTLPNPQANIGRLTAGAEGSLWFQDSASRHDKIGHLALDGKLTEYPLQSADRAAFTSLGEMTLRPDGNLWFAFSNVFNGSNGAAGPTSQTSIMRVSPDGETTIFKVLPPNVGADSLLFGPDGALWFSEGSRTGRLTMDGKLTEYPLGAPGKYGVSGICVGPDGALWYAWLFEGRIGRMTLSGNVQEFTVPYATEGLIVRGSDGALWFPEADPTAEQDGRALTRKGVIGRITTAGVFNDVAIGASLVVSHMIAGPDGAIWYSALDQADSTLKLGRVTSSGDVKTFSTNEAAAGAEAGGGDIAAAPGAIWMLDSHNALWRYPLPA